MFTQLYTVLAKFLIIFLTVNITHLLQEKPAYLIDEIDDRSSVNIDISQYQSKFINRLILEIDG